MKTRITGHNPDSPHRGDPANVHTIEFGKVTSGSEFWVMLGSDRHHDNIQSRWDLERKHLNRLRENDGLALDFGDLFCAMQGKYDPRSDMRDIRPEHVGTDYLDRIVDTAVEFYAPYAKHFAVVGWGNHETNVLKRHGYDLTKHFVNGMKRNGGRNIHQGAYSGWVRFHFQLSRTSSQIIKLKYHHGGGGGGPVTKGTIQATRQAVYLPDADIVANGHTHDGWYFPIARERLLQSGNIGRDIIHFVRTPGYKDEYNEGKRGFATEKWMPPKPLGMIWIRFFYDQGRVNFEFIPEIE